MFKEILKFNGTWRNYQARILEKADEYLKDGKIHIVAAPGSGKTTLGIECIIRLDEPVLILAPSITIREQWKSRIVSAFLQKKEIADSLISQDIKNPAPITIATYQALHSAMTRYTGTIDKEDEQEGEVVDFSGFNLVKSMHMAGIKVLCLDECHHLRSEWWKALEDFKKRMGNMKTIALTATPPYDSTPQAWNRYKAMCGEIDEEISVPELVKEGSLCPHQDYIYFNYPTKEEMESVNSFVRNSSEVFRFFLYNEDFEKVICSHCVLSKGMDASYMLENPSYLSSLLIYLEFKNISYPSHLKALIGSNKLPQINARWMEIMIQNVLFDSIYDFDSTEYQREEWIRILKQNGFIEKRKVVLSVNTSIEKMLISSKAKLNSILDIVDSEFDSLKDDLRMLVLTDYIRKEQERMLGSDYTISNLGVLPFFEAIRRQHKDLHLCVLCGSLVIIPGYTRENLLHIVGSDASKISFSSIGQLSQDEYVQVNVSGNSNFLTNAITELFNQGFIQVMIGTKSLLGEGWDSPCINSLILASFVGSFMLSNQMRGRAIRVEKGNLNKTSNIWHLVCVKPPSLIRKEEKEQQNVTVSEDWILLERRMKHFLGLHYEQEIIEDGIGRFSCIRQPFTKENVKKTNADMLDLSRKRNELIDRWQTALALNEHHEIVEETEVKANLLTSSVFFDELRILILCVILAIIFLFFSSTFSLFGIIFSTGFLSLIFGGYGLYTLNKILKVYSPYKRLKSFGIGLMQAMKESGFLKEDVYDVYTEQIDGIVNTICLKGGTEREKELFAKCIREFFAPVDNQRYILQKNSRLKGKYEYYCVPDIFSTNKEMAEIFNKHIEQTVGKYNLVYTRSAKGREILLAARKYSYANIQEKIVSSKKTKSKFE